MWPQSKVKFKEKAVKIEIKTLDLIYNIILKGRSHLLTFDDRLIRSLCSAHRKPLSTTAKDNPDATKTYDATSSFGVHRRLLTCPINSCQTNETTVVEESHHGLLVFLIPEERESLDSSDNGGHFHTVDVPRHFSPGFSLKAGRC